MPSGLVSVHPRLPAMPRGFHEPKIYSVPRRRWKWIYRLCDFAEDHAWPSFPLSSVVDQVEHPRKLPIGSAVIRAGNEGIYLDFLVDLVDLVVIGLGQQAVDEQRVIVDSHRAAAAAWRARPDSMTFPRIPLASSPRSRLAYRSASASLMKNFRSLLPFPDMAGGTDTIHPSVVSAGVNEGRFGMAPAITLTQQNGVCQYWLNEEARNPLKTRAGYQSRTDDLLITNQLLYH